MIDTQIVTTTLSTLTKFSYGVVVIKYGIEMVKINPLKLKGASKEEKKEIIKKIGQSTLKYGACVGVFALTVPYVKFIDKFATKLILKWLMRGGVLWTL